MLTFLTARPALAAGETIGPRKLRAVLVLVPGLSSEPMLRALREGAAPTLAQGSFALMNAVVPAPVTRESAYLTVGQGRRLRYGVPDPAPRPIPGLIAACGRAGIRFGYVGPVPGTEQPPGWLVVQTEEAVRGTAMGAVADTAQEAPAWVQATSTTLQDTELVIVDLPRSGGNAASAAAALAVAEGIAGLLNPENDLLLLASPDPGEPMGGQWMGLSPIVAWGAGIQAGLLTSATTRTPGILANVDLTPAILAHLKVAIPAGMEGHAIRTDTVKRGESLTARTTLLLDLAAQLRLNRQAMVPVLVGWGLLALAAVIIATWALLTPAFSWWVNSSRLLLAMTAAGPVAFLILAAAQVGRPESLAVVLGSTYFAFGFLTFQALFLQNRRDHQARHTSRLLEIYSLSVLVMLADLLLGTRMLTFNLMSDMPNLGARFYGIGNEYQGMLLGASILLPCVRLGNKAPNSFWWMTTVGLWLLVLFAVGAPFLGADFGGAVSGALAFILSGCLIARFRPKPWQMVVGAALFAVGVAGLVGLDLLRPPGDRTHVGELATRALTEGLGPVWEIAWRKLLLNIRMAQTPYFLGGVAAVTPLLWLWYSKLGPPTRRALSRQPYLRAGLLGTAGGAVIVGLLNDTGVIAWALMTISALLIWLDLLLEEHLAGEKSVASG